MPVCETGKPVIASDGLTGRCVGPCSEEKYYYISRYLDIFTSGMKNKFPRLDYIDLFAGPGRCVKDDGTGEFPGTPIAALQVRHPFSAYHLVEAGRQEAAALQQRVSQARSVSLVHFYPEGANAAVDKILTQLPRTALSVAVIDPTALQLQFESLRRLTEGRRMDLIYLFPEGMAVKRNLETFLKQSESSLDLALGTREWRDKYTPDSLKTSSEPARLRSLLEILRARLHALGYQHVLIGDEIVFRNRKQVPLYMLVFASKNPRGHEFWKKIQEIGPTGQRKLSL